MYHGAMPCEISSEEAAIRDRAKVFARKNGKSLSAELTDIGLYPSDPNPVSVFMAGSPGAGKTEASKALLDNVEKKGTRTVRIDPDELRERFEEYSGDNVWLFQPATSILVDKIHDRVLKNEQYFAARKVVNQLKEDFDKDIVVTLLLKNLDGSDKVYKANVDKIDNHIPEKYSESDLLEMISGTSA